MNRITFFRALAGAVLAPIAAIAVVKSAASGPSVEDALRQINAIFRKTHGSMDKFTKSLFETSRSEGMSKRIRQTVLDTMKAQIRHSGPPR